jgi:hypothetical protein
MLERPHHQDDETDSWPYLAIAIIVAVAISALAIVVSS